MRRLRLTSLCACIFLTLMLLIFQCSRGYAETFTGRVVDDKGNPIVDAVVVAVWWGERGNFAGNISRPKDVKETVTDSNGAWSLEGQSGVKDDSNIIQGFFLVVITFLTGTYYTKPPQFIIYKPGYCPYGGGLLPEPCKLKRIPLIVGNGETFELTELLDPKDRERAIPQPAVGQGNYEELLNKQQKLIDRINEEQRHLGLRETNFQKLYRPIYGK